MPASMLVHITVSGGQATITTWPRAARGETVRRIARMEDLETIAFGDLLAGRASALRARTRPSRTAQPGSHGERLYAWLFGDAAEQLQVFGDAFPDEDAHDGAHGPVILTIRSTAPEILTIPWHIMSVAGQRLVADTAWVVLLQRAEAPEPQPASPPPFGRPPRILLVAPELEGDDIGTRAHVAEIEALVRAATPPGATLTRATTESEVRDALASAPTVVYFFGHGIVDGDGVACMRLRRSADDGSAVNVPVSGLRRALRDAAPHLVYLNCCSVGRGGRASAAVDLWDAAWAVVTHACDVFAAAAGRRGVATLTAVLAGKHPAVAICESATAGGDRGHEWMSAVVICRARVEQWSVEDAGSVPKALPPRPRTEVDEPLPVRTRWMAAAAVATLAVGGAGYARGMWPRTPLGVTAPEPPRSTSRDVETTATDEADELLRCLRATTVSAPLRAELHARGQAPDGVVSLDGLPPGSSASVAQAIRACIVARAVAFRVTIPVRIDGTPARDGLALWRDEARSCTVTDGRCIVELPSDGVDATPLELREGTCPLGTAMSSLADRVAGTALAFATTTIDIEIRNVPRPATTKIVAPSGRGDCLHVWPTTCSTSVLPPEGTTCSEVTARAERRTAFATFASIGEGRPEHVEVSTGSTTQDIELAKETDGRDGRPRYVGTWNATTPWCGRPGRRCRDILEDKCAGNVSATRKRACDDLRNSIPSTGNGVIGTACGCTY